MWYYDFRTYLSGSPTDASHNLHTVSLLDLYLQKIYSLEDYKKIVEKLKQDYPDLAAYLENFLMFVYGDHPTFATYRKLLAQNDIALPLFSRLGPFHIWYNTVELAGSTFHHIFNIFQHSLFGSKLPAKPKFHHLTYLSTILLTSWISCRDQVMQHFYLSKDPEYQSLLFLLEEVVPISVLVYSVVFRSNNIEEWEAVLGRIQFLFMTWHRKRYNKATLATITENDFFKENCPELYDVMAASHSFFSEYKVELYHSVLRRNSSNNLKPEEIIKIARAIASKEFKSHFDTIYGKDINGRPYNPNYSTVSNKATEVMIDIFEKVAHNAGNSKVIVY